MATPSIAGTDSMPEVPELRRAMGLGDVVLFFVIAGSNFQWVATAAAAGPSSLVVWLIGGIAMFLPLSLVVVYLSAHHPDEGGLYVWSKRAFGPFAGFMTGWTYWASNLPYFPALLYFTAGNALFISGTSGGILAASPWYYIAVSIAGLGLATILNVYGLAVGKWLNNVGALGRWIATMLLIALGVMAWLKFGPATPINATTARLNFQFKDIIFWSVIAFAWTGPEAASFMAGEIKNPRRSIPLGLVLAAPMIAAIYIAGTASVLAALPASSVNASSGVMQTIGITASRFGWPWLTPIAAVLVTISCLGSAGAWLGAVARIPFVAGIDRFLPPIFGRMHPRFRSPVVAILTQAGIAAVFIFLGQGGTTVKGAYDVLVSTTVLITMVPFLFLFASAIKLYVDPSGADPLRIPGGRWTVAAAGVIGFTTTAASMVLSAFPADDDPHKALAVIKVLGMTALMIGGGMAVYFIGRRVRSVQDSVR
ncbi:MAG TPA: APC family permease [Candidatus Eremiobacteraceae bacterium]|nr:APC family permease [Candidatus Eremiobacteraceae bacterium]